MSTRSDVARRYATWIERHRIRIVALSLALAAVCGVLASRLSIRSDFSYLLPQSARSVKDLRAIERRARVIGTAMIAVQSANPQHREQAAREVRERLLGLGETLVASVTFDRRVERQYAWTHRWLFADLSDLEAARDALADEIAQAKLAANPLYVSLDDDSPAKPSHGAEDKLRAKLRDAERARDEPAELVSKDGHVQLLIVHTAFSTGDIDRDRRLVEAMDKICADVHAELPDVELGPAGDAVVSLYEHDAILNGMLRATIVTVALVLLALGWYFRSSLAIGALSWSLVVGTLVDVRVRPTRARLPQRRDRVPVVDRDRQRHQRRDHRHGALPRGAARRQRGGRRRSRSRSSGRSPARSRRR